MKLTITLLLASLPLLAVGGEALYHALASRQPVALTCDQLAAAPAQPSRVRLSGCQLGDDMGHRDAGGQITELMFPVRRSGQPRSEPAIMIASTTDPEVLAIAQETIGGGRQPDEEARTVMILRIVTALNAAPEIEGMARRGVLNALSTRRTLAAVDVPLAPGASVLDVNERPRVMLPAALAATGAVLLLLALTRLLRRPAASPGAALADEPPSAAGVMPVADERIAGLMLLNLDAAAGRDAIEQAPALGPREQVEQTISRAIPGLAFDNDGHGTLTSDTASMAIDLGRGPVAWTAVLDARGIGVYDSVRALIGQTGWRVYYPKRGTFLGADDLGLP